jgi:hypothetical protein
MSSNNDIINNGVTDYGICCDECEYEIEDDVTGVWRDGVTAHANTAIANIVPSPDFVKQPNRITAEQIWRRRDEVRNEQERIRVPESEDRRIREEAEREEAERERKKNAALWNILAKQESARIQRDVLEKLREQSEEVMELLREEEDRIEQEEDDSLQSEEEDLIENSRLTCEYTGPEEQDPRYDYDSLQSDDRSLEEEESYDWIQAHANKFWSPPPTTVSRDGELSRSYDWDPKPEWDPEWDREKWTPCERRACCEILDCEILDDEDSSPLDDDHLQKINAIHQLKPKNLVVLSDYANLCEISLLDAYHYKSRCHLYSCNKPLDPDYWDAEQNVQFCCRRHGEYFEDCGHIEEDIDCKVCYSRPHQKNLVSYRALKQSNQGFGPIVSAIRVFDELCMSNILFDSLVDLCEFY